MILDKLAGWVYQLLGMVSENAAKYLFVPVFLATVIVGFVLLVHRAAAPLTRFATAVLTGVIAGAGAFLLLGEMVVADGYRRRGNQPPAAVYNLGDMVASTAVGLSAGIRKAMTAVAGVLSKAKVWLLVLLCGVWIVIWNHQHCPDGATGCSRPLSGWGTQQVSGGQP
ncbi:hypothetical protein OHA21_19165 [Actinoplanes sp. NBC_00393]|uniref:hypothetical protein n=1 Tax=Actinoplanes sp. NBC_00393 TaxID=2975953 RepID=UPI002E1A2AB3